MSSKTKGKSVAPKTDATEAAPVCQICGAAEVKLQDVHGNQACEACALAVQQDQHQETADEKRAKASALVATLTTASEGYLKSMSDAGASDTTLRAYRAELRIAMDELGAGTALAELTPTRVGEYFASPRVTHTRSGDEASPLSVAKRRRVLRQALVWSVEAGLVAQAPIPQ